MAITLSRSACGVEVPTSAHNSPTTPIQTPITPMINPYMAPPGITAAPWLQLYVACSSPARSAKYPSCRISQMTTI